MALVSCYSVLSDLRLLFAYLPAFLWFLASAVLRGLGVWDYVCIIGLRIRGQIELNIFLSLQRFHYVTRLVMSLTFAACGFCDVLG